MPGARFMRSMLFGFLLMQFSIRTLEAALNATREVITSPDVVKPTDPYSHAICVGDTMYLSGQTGTDPQTGRLVPGGIVPQTRQAISRFVDPFQVLTNLGKVLEAGHMNFTNVVKCTVYLADMNDYEDMNKIYAEFFAEKPPARVTIRAAELPRRARVEIEAIAVDTAN
ncbi:unnamed protein product [Ixodes hexagonus]